jgi:glycerophosphoryl diester phosphodiesterase
MKLALALLLTVTALAQAPAPLVMGHRGCRALRSENTLAAFRHALELGVDVIEFDAVVTADDRLLVNHDVSVNLDHCFLPGGRTPAAPLYIRLLPTAELQRFDCGTRKNKSYPNQIPVPGARMPAVEEVFSLLRDADVDMMVETKMARDGDPHFVPPRHFAGLLHREIERHGVRDRIILQSFDHRTLREMHKLDPTIRLCLLNPRTRLDDYLTPARDLNATYQFINWAIIEPGDVELLHDAGIKVFSGTTDDPKIWRRLRDLNVDGILTDDPAGLLSELRSNPSTAQSGGSQ